MFEMCLFVVPGIYVTSWMLQEFYFLKMSVYIRFWMNSNSQQLRPAAKSHYVMKKGRGYVWPCYMNPFRSYAPFCYKPLPLPRPPFASCPLAHDRHFHCRPFHAGCVFSLWIIRTSVLFHRMQISLCETATLLFFPLRVNFFPAFTLRAKAATNRDGCAEQTSRSSPT